MNPSCDLNLENIKAYLKTSNVLIAGGAGSIGSELAIQINRIGCNQLIIADIDENGLQEIKRRFDDYGQIIEAHLTDLKNPIAVRNLFHWMNRRNIDVVFDCAAHKHVSVGEKNPSEVVYNNLMSTKLLLNASTQAGTDKFIFISTDKAVEPKGVMGASKALCESVIREHKLSWPKKYILRFGNVLGSRGSVLEVWKKQLEAEQPLTVTDMRMRRYCMNIDAACQLILKCMEYPSGTYVLDMGKKITVKQLLEDFLIEHGKSLGEDSWYIENGIQPGEKMTEQLFWPSEKFRKLSTANIYKVRDSPSFKWNRFLKIASRYDDRKTLKALEKQFEDIGWTE